MAKGESNSGGQKPAGRLQTVQDVRAAIAALLGRLRELQGPRGAGKRGKHAVADWSPNVGDRVRVREGAAHDQMTADAEGEIAGISDERALAVRFAGMDGLHRWYVASELELVSDGRSDQPREKRRDDGAWPEDLNAPAAHREASWGRDRQEDGARG